MYLDTGDINRVIERSNEPLNQQLTATTIGQPHTLPAKLAILQLSSSKVSPSSGSANRRLEANLLIRIDSILQIRDSNQSSQAPKLIECDACRSIC